jgi:hypothetical protein
VFWVHIEETRRVRFSLAILPWERNLYKLRSLKWHSYRALTILCSTPDLWNEQVVVWIGGIRYFLRVPELDGCSQSVITARQYTGMLGFWFSPGDWLNCNRMDTEGFPFKSCWDVSDIEELANTSGSDVWVASINDHWSQNYVEVRESENKGGMRSEEKS